MTTYDDLAALAGSHVMPTYGARPIALSRGSGSTVWDSEGRSYLDLVAGIAVCSVGHSHPRVVAAAADQLGRLTHSSNLFLNEPSVRLAERLAGLIGRPAKSFFANSGAEANEAAIKLVRKHGLSRAAGKVQIVATDGSFHGRTTGALAITGQPAKRAPFGPLLSDVTFVPYGDEDALRAAVGPQTAGVVLEPIQGEIGVLVPPAGYLAAAREVTTRHDALLVLDEVQTGVGRTGEWFAWQGAGVLPDVMTLAKGLAGGLPIGVCMGFGPAGDVLTAGEHGSTFGGNPVVCAAALAVLDVIEAEDLLTRAKVSGERLADGLAGAPGVASTRGAGLVRAMVLASPVAKELEAAARDAGFLVNALGADVVRLAPPLVITDEEIDRFVAAVPGMLDGLAPAAPAAG
ncbi:MAG TPA: acetylornithine transaminase [Mycobacteriales bacterium]|jgi:acetylornithine aminotransferase|nr:acetylornithine transaminase [Mycobacteriales bacterium]